MTNVIWGYGGEDIVSRHAQAFTNENTKSKVVNPSLKDPEIKFNEPINILTSNHFTRTVSDMRILFPESNISSDFFEIARINNIKNLFFFCHDHSEIFVLEESLNLCEFRAVITPWPTIHKNSSKMELFCCDIAFKNIEEFKKVHIKRRAVWLVSNLKHNIQRFGVTKFAQQISIMIEQCEVSIKIPEYGDLGRQLEKELLSLGIDVIPSELSTETILLETEIVISSALSGVASLASYYNRPTITITNNHPEETINPNSSIEKNTMWLDNACTVANNKELRKELSKSINTSNRSHACGIFRDDFIEKYHRELFSR